jgi:uncharacterized DUF497 family protein
MEFEFDPKKSKKNKEDRGVDFVEAQVLWENKHHEIPVPKKSPNDENRWIVVGTIQNALWLAVITYRESKVRIISVRRCKPKEVEVWKKRSR